jgi:hypothetical protein
MLTLQKGRIMHAFSSAVLAVLVFLASALYADETGTSKEESPHVLTGHLTYGPGGPKRKNNGFLDETFHVRLELPKQFSSDGRTDLLHKISVASRVNKIQRLSSERPFLIEGFSTRNFPSFFHFFFSVPKDFDEGIYDIEISVMTKNGVVIGEWKETIELYPLSRFGIIDLRFLHGSPDIAKWAPGSNIFVASQTARFSFDIVGLHVDSNNEVSAKVKIVLVDQEGVSVDIHARGPVPILKARVSETERLKTWPFSQELHLAQAGDFVLKIEVEDLNSQKKEFYELPIFVFDPNKYSVPSMPVQSFSSDPKSTVLKPDSSPKSESSQY